MMNFKLLLHFLEQNIFSLTIAMNYRLLSEMTLSRNWTTRLASWRPSIMRNWERCRNKGRPLESYRRHWQRVTLNWMPLAKLLMKRWVMWSLFSYTHNESCIFLWYFHVINLMQKGKMLALLESVQCFITMECLFTGEKERWVHQTATGGLDGVSGPVQCLL